MTENKYFLTTDGGFLMIPSNAELYHHGVKGMKWGVRKKHSYTARVIRGHAGPGVRIGSAEKRLAGAKKDLERLDRGQHLSVGLTKKRQDQYDARDRKALNKKITKLEAKMDDKINRQREVVESWKDKSAIKDKKGNTIFSQDEVAQIRDGAIKRLEKLEYKKALREKMDQINAGESVAGRIYNKLTGADKIQAEIELDIEKRSKVNKAWRD